jgi:hypothetical protein
VVASAKRKKGGRKSFVYKKESFGKKENVVFYASLCTKRREGVFSPSAQKRQVLVTFTKVISKVSQVLSTVYYLISKELQLRRYFLITGFSFVILHE